MQENGLIVQWVQQCLEQRVSSYRWGWSGWCCRRRTTRPPMPTA